MGWTYMHAIYYTDSGAVDKKKELDNHFTYESNIADWRVLKSSMVGKVYYAAVEYTPKEGNTNFPKHVFALICLTNVRPKEYCNFGFKDVAEECGPCEIECPISILKLLSPTESVYANAWRKRCYEYHEWQKSPDNPKNLPVGSVISFNFDGKVYNMRKMAPQYQFKTPWWYSVETNKIIKTKNIPQDFEILYRG